MTDKEEYLASMEEDDELTPYEKRFAKEAMTIGEFAKMWSAAPWLAHMRLHQLERDGVMVSGMLKRDYVSKADTLTAEEKEERPDRAVKDFMLVSDDT